MLHLDKNIFLSGHHPSVLDPRKQDPRIDIIFEQKPDVLVVDKPQDLRSYTDRVLAGERLKDVSRSLFNETFMNPILFRRDCVPLMRACKEAGIPEVYFVDFPSYIGNVAPFYLDNKFGDQTTREGLMSLRLKEIQLRQPEGRKILMFVEDTLQLNIFQGLPKLTGLDLGDIQRRKKELADRLIHLLKAEMSEYPICMGSTVFSRIKKRTRDNCDQIEAVYRGLLREIVSDEAGSEMAITEARQLSDILCELRFSMFKLYADRTDSSLVERLKKAKRELDFNMGSDRLRQDFLVEMKYSLISG
jgi:hypothetical protein